MIDRSKYPGKYITPGIPCNAGEYLTWYWSLSYEKRREIKEERDRLEAIKRKKFSWKIMHRIWYLRGKLADFIAPEGWFDCD